MPKLLKQKLFLPVLTLFISGCGGGTSNSTSNESADTQKIQPPVFNSAKAVDFSENDTAPAYQAIATTNTKKTIRYSLAGQDSAFLNIDPETGLVSFIVPPDYEDPRDSNSDNSYEIVLTASISSPQVSSEQAVSINVTNDNLFSLITTFPPASGNIGGYDHSAIAGVIIDSEDGIVEKEDLGSLLVNGVTAIQNVDKPNLWHASLLTQTPSTTFTIKGEFSDETVIDEQISVHNQPAMSTNDRFVFNTQQQKLIVSDSALSEVFSVSLESLSRTPVMNSQNGRISLHLANSPMTLSMDGETLYFFTPYYGLVSLNLSDGSYTRLNGTGPEVSNPHSMALKSSSNHLLLTSSNGLYSIDLETGNKRIISDSATGTGEAFQSPRGVTYDSVRNRAIISDVTRLIAVDITTGNRTIMSSESTGLGPSISQSGRLIHDSITDIIYLINYDAIYAVNPENGNRTLLSGDGEGTGPVLGYLSSLAINSAENTLIVSEPVSQTFTSIDISTGNRTTIFNNDIASGPPLKNSKSLSIDSDREILVTTDPISRSIIGVDLGSGNRTIISDDGVGIGPPLKGPRHLDVDSVSGIAYFYDGENGIVKANLETGNREILSNDTIGSGPKFSIAAAISVDQYSRDFFILDTTQKAIFKINKDTGARSIISSLAVGTGPDFILPRQILHHENNKIYVTDSGYPGVIAIDPVSGGRTILSSNTIGLGNTIRSPFYISKGIGNDTILISDYSEIFSINLENGNRKTVANYNSQSSIKIPIAPLQSDRERNLIYLIGEQCQCLFSIQPETGARALLSM